MSRRAAAAAHLLRKYRARPDPPPPPAGHGDDAASPPLPPPLVMAAALGDGETCAALLAAGADPGAADADGDTALTHALRAGDDGLAGLLRRYGARDPGPAATDPAQ
jgi:ankyrin repeat protein